jgi:cation diffusion facilitator family transporter
MNSPLNYDRNQADREKRTVALSSLLAALLLTTLKIVVGVLTNSLGILSEAAHSGLDLVAAGVTFWAVRASGQPADRDHTYGHAKIENLSALFETLLLLVTCVWIIYEGVRRLFFAEEVIVDASLWAFLVIGLSIVVDFSRSRALGRAARKHQSQALEADALHFSTDIWSSCVVLLGLFGVLAAERFGVPWLEKADSVAALGVALIVVWVSLQLGKKSIDDLLDRVPHDLQSRIVAAARRVKGVTDVTQVRVRRAGPESFADVTLAVDHASSFEGAHDIASAAEAAVRSVLPTADVVVHVEPVRPVDEKATTVIRLLAARLGLGAHGIRIYETAGGRSVELHLEVDESLTLDAAHQKASDFEQALQAALPDLGRIVTHLEPAGDGAATQSAAPAGESEIAQAIQDFFAHEPLAVTPHDIRVQHAAGELAVSFHCTLDAGTAITAAHDLTERVENYLRTRIPRLGRVVIHVEPSGSQDGD